MARPLSAAAQGGNEEARRGAGGVSSMAGGAARPAFVSYFWFVLYFFCSAAHARRESMENLAIISWRAPYLPNKKEALARPPITTERTTYHAVRTARRAGGFVRPRTRSVRPGLPSRDVVAAGHCRCPHAAGRGAAGGSIRRPRIIPRAAAAVCTGGRPGDASYRATKRVDG